MNKLLEVSDTEKFDDNQGDNDLGRKGRIEGNLTYQFYFDENDFPSFSGDYMEYMEWKGKWNSLVSPYIENSSLEMSLLKENIPERGKKRLFDIHTLPEAWEILDELYENKKLICQILRNN